MADAASLSLCLSNKDATSRLICKFKGSAWRAFGAMLVALYSYPAEKMSGPYTQQFKSWIRTSSRWYCTRRYVTSLRGLSSCLYSTGSDRISESVASTSPSSSVSIPIPARVLIAIKFSGSEVMLKW
jgi:hypothetical protein